MLTLNFLCAIFDLHLHFLTQTSAIVHKIQIPSIQAISLGDILM